MNLRTWWIIGGAAALASGIVAACSSSSDSPALATGGAGGDDLDAGTEAESSLDAHYEAPPPCPDAPETVECTSYEGGAPLKDDAIYGINYIYSDRGRDRKPDPDAWKSYGFDLDGQATTESSTNHCQLVAGSNAKLVKTDGVNGIDNSFTPIIGPLIHGFDTGNLTWIDTWTGGIVGGGPTIIMRLPDLQIPPPPDAGSTPPSDAGFDANDPPPNVGPVSDAGATTAMRMLGYTSAKNCDMPTWETPHMVPVDFMSTGCGKVDEPLFAAPKATLTGDYWYSGELPEATMIIPVHGAPLRVRLKKVRVEMYLSADRQRATLGNLGGIMNTEEFVAAVASIRGFINKAACSPLLFDGFATTMRQASDIMDDGTQDPTQECNGISVGLGFDAARVQLGSLVTIPIPTDPCPPPAGP